MKSFDINLINPYIRTAIHSVIKAGREINRRVILDYELIYIKKGEFTLEYDGTDHNCKSGDFLFIQPGIRHSFKNINFDLSQPHIHFDMIYDDKSAKRFISFKDFDDLTECEKRLIHKDIFKGGKQTPFISFSNTQKALELFYTVINSNDKKQLKTRAAMLQITDMIIEDNLLSKTEYSGGYEYSVCQQIKDYIDSGQGLDTSLCEYEKQFSYSKYYIEKQFKKSFGTSLIAYRNKKRMELAKEMLKSYNISTVSERLGFSSIYSFSRAFKNHYGICPSKIKIS